MSKRGDPKNEGARVSVPSGSARYRTVFVSGALEFHKKIFDGFMFVLKSDLDAGGFEAGEFGGARGCDAGGAE